MENLMILGPVNAVLIKTLGLPDGATVGDMIVEIKRLKMAAAEGPIEEPKVQSDSQKPKVRKHTYDRSVNRDKDVA